jgi:hypothetical protein
MTQATTNASWTQYQMEVGVYLFRSMAQNSFYKPERSTCILEDSTYSIIH